MNALRRTIAFIGGVAALGMAGCSLMRGDPEVRYKVTVEVIENGHVRSGSSVWSWRLSEPDLPLASTYDGKFRGEAVAVELAGGRNLFALLRSSDSESGMAELLPERLFGDLGRPSRGEAKRFSPDRAADLRDIGSRIGEIAVLDCAARPDWCPMLVLLRDAADPTSIEHVEPGNLAGVVGPGYALRAIIVEITDEPVTLGIKERLDWLESVGRQRATLLPDPPRRLADARPIQLVRPSSFTTELYK